MSATNTEHIDPNTLIIIKESGFLTVVWTCVGVSFLFVVLRAFVRLRVFGKFMEDDFFVLLAWLILLTCNILWHIRKTLDLVYLSFLVGYGVVSPSPYYIEHLVNWLRILFAELLLGMLGIWSIKFSFLVYFRRLSENIRGERILWWVATVITVVLLAVSIGVSYYPCIFATFEFETTFCPTPEAGTAIYRSYRIQFACDFVSDFLIMLIPVKLLWKVKMSLRRKLGILGLFFLIGVTMVFSLVRIVVGLRGPREDDVWFFLCATIELTIGIIVACLVSYPALYKSERQKRVTTESYKMYTPWNGKHSAPRKMTTLDSHDDSYGNEISGNNRQKKGTSRNGSETQLTAHSNQHTESIPLDVINVESRYEVFHSAHG